MSDYQSALRKNKKKISKGDFPGWYVPLADPPIRRSQFPPGYVYRSALLWELKQSVLSGLGNKILVTGPSKQGKSTAVQSLVFEPVIRANFEQIYWVDGSKGLDLARLSLIGAVTEIDLETYRFRNEMEVEAFWINNVVTKLKKKTVLIVVVGVNSTEVVQDIERCLGNNSKLVFTSRSSSLQQKLKVETVVNVDKLTHAEAIEMVKKKLRNTSSPFEAEILSNLPAWTDWSPFPLQISTDLIKEELGDNRVLEELYWGNEFSTLHYDQAEATEHSLEMSYDESYYGLPDDAKQCFHAMSHSLISHPTIGIPILAYVLGWTIERTKGSLVILASRSLIRRVSMSEYVVPRLMRQYADRKCLQYNRQEFDRIGQVFSWIQLCLVVTAIETGVLVDLGKNVYYIPKGKLLQLFNTIIRDFPTLIIDENTGLRLLGIRQHILQQLNLPDDTDLWIRGKIIQENEIPIIGDQLLDHFHRSLIIFIMW